MKPYIKPQSKLPNKGKYVKIGLVLDDTLDTPDGVQQYVLQVGKWLASQGHEVHYLVGQTNRTDIANIHSLSRNLRVKFNGNRMSMPLPTSKRRMRRFLAAEQFDVLHVQVPYSPFMAGQLLRAAPASTAVIGTFHILPYSSLVTLANRGLALLNWWSGRRFDQMLAVSEPARQYASKIYGYHSQVVPNPVNLAQFKSARSDSSDTNIVFLGRLVARKGALQLLKAVDYLLRNKLYVNQLQLIIGGRGEQLLELEQYAHDHGLSELITFAGFVSEDEKASFLAQADVAVYPSTGGESFGIVLLEGMAAARGVVLAGNNPGYASVMQPYPKQLVDPNDTVAFAKSLAWYLEHDEARVQASQAQHTYVQQFDVAQVGSRLLAVYEQALQSRHKS